MKINRQNILEYVHTIPECGCWIWAGGWMAGYGATQYREIGYGKVHRRAHRVVWELFNGSIPPDTFLCHKCDTKPCCNPSHLFLGTHTDNMRDASKKGKLKGRKAFKVLDIHIEAIIKNDRSAQDWANELDTTESYIKRIRKCGGRPSISTV